MKTIVWDTEGNNLGEMNLELEIDKRVIILGHDYIITHWEQEFFPHQDEYAEVLVKKITIQ